MLAERLKLFYIKIVWPVYSKFLARFLGLPSALQPQQHQCCLHEPPSSNILWFEGVILCVKHFPPLTYKISNLDSFVHLSAPTDVIMCPAFRWSQKHPSATVKKANDPSVASARNSRFQVVHHPQISSKDFETVPCGILDSVRPIGSQVATLLQVFNFYERRTVNLFAEMLVVFFF